MSITLPENKLKNRLEASRKLIQTFSKHINCIRDNREPYDFVILGTSNTSRSTNYFKIKEGTINKTTFFGSYTEIWKPQPDGSYLLVLS